MFLVLPALSFYWLVSPILFLLAILFAAFLFWRAGRYEYIESIFLLDILLIAGAGAFIGARLFDLIFNFPVYKLFIVRFVFFNAYGGLDVWGGLFGGILSVFLFLRRKRAVFLTVVDLAAAPLIFGLFVYSIANLTRGNYDALAYFVLFVVVKRLELKKRRKGFFACFALVAVSLIGLIFYRPTTVLDYQLTKPIGFLTLGLITWYFLSKRSVAKDVKGMLGWFLLLGFGVRRVISSVREADKLSKNIVLSPFYLSKAVYIFVRILTREIYLSMVGLMQALGVKK